MSRWSEDYKQGEKDYRHSGRPDYDRDKFASYDSPDRDYFDGFNDAKRREDERREDERREEARQEREAHEQYLEEQQAQQQYEDEQRTEP